ncbi:alpha/beta fold hydrolase [Hyphomicrobium sp. D-2]|uniref:alpha/beta hydrolase n=1 Tax=Hyphomicrobium sp. D-2 TaxID=3041621 RepID=UPI002458F394|nr:alpha/beta fold hydrolase [Hyphomicrobium sp. D-2]MDH4982061.1 alpha/beta fold hydrolase [Hyphomicrobium sp. D-2]
MTMTQNASAQAPASSAPQFKSESMEAPGPNGPLQGTLVIPPPAASLAADARALAPVVLIVPGSGPTDRDGNNPLGVKAAPYRLLAEDLAARGIASVRIDKRGMFGSAQAISDPNAVTIGDYADDVRTWVQSIIAHTGAPCVWVLGHSEGGLVALASYDATAKVSDSDICGLMLVSAPGRKLGDVLRAQLKANPANAPLLPQALDAISQLEAGRRVDAAKLDPALLSLFHPAVQGFLIDALTRDPAALIANYRKPVLIVQGRADLQTDVQDAERLKGANAAAQLVLLDNVNHVLKRVPADDKAANMASYGDPGLPIASEVGAAIADFIARYKPH